MGDKGVREGEYSPSVPSGSRAREVVQPVSQLGTGRRITWKLETRGASHPEGLGEAPARVGGGQAG